MKYQYRKVYAFTKPNCQLYEADMTLECAMCGSVIEMNTFFRRGSTRNYIGFSRPWCRECLSFSVLTEANGSVVAAENESEFVYSTEEEKLEYLSVLEAIRISEKVERL